MTDQPAHAIWPWAMLLAVALASAAGAAALRRYALAKDMIDIPGRRSSHHIATPRGGGLAGVLAWLAATAALWAWGGLAPAWAGALGGGGALCLAAGWCEDRFGLHMAARMALHVTAAALALAYCGGLPLIELGPVSLKLGPWGWLAGMLWLVWFVNLFNFMDGIDGIASLQTICGGGALGLMLAWSGQWPLAFCAFALAAAATGFLTQNWPPAKIFMGDAGSYGFGFGLAALSLVSHAAGAVPAASALIVQMLFLFDATATIIRRLLRGEAIHRPHRSHYYQRAVQSGLGHGQVDLAVAALNMVLTGLALAVYFRPNLAPAALAASVALAAAACAAVARRERAHGGDTA